MSNVVLEKDPFEFGFNDFAELIPTISEINYMLSQFPPNEELERMLVK